MVFFFLGFYLNCLVLNLTIVNLKAGDQDGVIVRAAGIMEMVAVAGMEEIAEAVAGEGAMMAVNENLKV